MTLYKTSNEYAHSVREIITYSLPTVVLEEKNAQMCPDR